MSPGAGPDPILFGPDALELEPRAITAAAEAWESWQPWNRSTWCPVSSHGVLFRTAGLSKKLTKRVRRFAERYGLDLEADATWAFTRVKVKKKLARKDRVAAILRATWQTASAQPDPPLLMGVVNVTPDSFSDGGRYLEPDTAADHGARLAEAGACLIDVGGESTRPGSKAVDTDEELRRVIPVIEELGRRNGHVALSVDTRKATVAARAIDAGATIVNDVSAGRADPDMLPLVAERGVSFVCMHMQGTPGDMQKNPRYTDVVAEVLDFLRTRVAICLQAGIRPDRIFVDPGIGFGKRLEHNVELLRRLPELRSLGLPLLLGVSRKSFIAHVNRAWDAPPETHAATGGGLAVEHVGGTAAAVTACVLGGAAVLRVHDVATMSEAARVAAALAGIGPTV